MKRFTLSALTRLTAATLGLLMATSVFSAAQTYQKGDIIAPFSLINRANGQPVSRDDLAGKIVFMEWFAWWCPFCQIAASSVGPALRTAYPAGNPAGIEIIHVGVNLQPNAEAQTENFLNNTDFDTVLNDFNRALANRFQSGGQPIFAILNGVAGSPSHQQWELLLHQNGYGDLDFSDNLALFQTAIDSVLAPPPRVGMLTVATGAAPTLEAVIPPGHVGTIEVSTNLVDWDVLQANLPGGGTVVVEDAQPRPDGRAFYRIVAQRVAGP